MGVELEETNAITVMLSEAQAKAWVSYLFEQRISGTTHPDLFFAMQKTMFSLQVAGFEYPSKTVANLDGKPSEIEFSNGLRALVTKEERDDLLKDGIQIKGVNPKPTKQGLAINLSIRFAVAILLSIVIEAMQAGSWNWFNFVGRSVSTMLVVAVAYGIELWWKARSIKATA
jgi:hypothetical protein